MNSLANYHPPVFTSLMTPEEKVQAHREIAYVALSQVVRRMELQSRIDALGGFVSAMACVMALYATFLIDTMPMAVVAVFCAINAYNCFDHSGHSTLGARRLRSEIVLARNETPEKSGTDTVPAV